MSRYFEKNLQSAPQAKILTKITSANHVFYTKRSIILVRDRFDIFRQNRSQKWACRQDLQKYVKSIFGNFPWRIIGLRNVNNDFSCVPVGGVCAVHVYCITPLFCLPGGGVYTVPCTFFVLTTRVGGTLSLENIGHAPFHHGRHKFLSLLIVTVSSHPIRMVSRGLFRDIIILYIKTVTLFFTLCADFYFCACTVWSSAGEKIQPDFEDRAL